MTLPTTSFNIDTFEKQWETFIKHSDNTSHLEQLSTYNTLRTDFEKAHTFWIEHYDAWCKTCETQSTELHTVENDTALSIEHFVKQHQQLQHQIQMALEENMQIDNLMELWKKYNSIHFSLLYALNHASS